MITVFGATGNTGSPLVDALLAKGAKVRAVTSDSAKIESLRAKGCEAVIANFTDPGALKGACEDAEKIYLVTPAHLDMRRWKANAIAAAKRTGLTLVPRRVAHAHSQAEQLQRLLEDVDALWLISDPTVLSSTESITNLFAQADQKKVPVFSYKHLFVDYGATLSITADEVTSGRQAAVMLHQLMQADKPLPAVQFPAGSAITLNLDRVRRYQLNLNRTALDSVRELVDSTR